MYIHPKECRETRGPSDKGTWTDKETPEAERQRNIGTQREAQRERERGEEKPGKKWCDDTRTQGGEKKETRSTEK